VITNIALGSNIGNPRENVETAIKHIEKLGRLVARSSLYATKPWGVVDQPDFCNAAVQIDTDLSAHELLRALQEIEGQMGRTATYRWGPRLIDLDLLTFGQSKIDDPLLTVPHPHMSERSFVLVPLAEIDKSFEPIRDQLPASSLAEVRLMPA
jgi:2-amino-4-hydroxy-6-hydroxymethyldihydropteridine diphosphokinase